MARTHSSLDSASNDLDAVCRLRNGVDDLLRELLKGKPELQLPWPLEPAAAWLKFLCCWQAVRSEDSHSGGWHHAIPHSTHHALIVVCSS